MLTCEHCGKVYDSIVLPLRCTCGKHSSPSPVDSPLPNHWLPLHQYPVDHADDWSTAAAADWYADWERRIPSIACDCRRNWSELVAQFPPDFSSAIAFARWAWRAHDMVSERIGKPRITWDECREMYGVSGRIE